METQKTTDSGSISAAKIVKFVSLAIPDLKLHNGVIVITQHDTGTNASR